MADIPIQNVVMAGLVPAFNAAAAGDEIPYTEGDRLVLVVNNGSGASINVTLTPNVASAVVPGLGSVAVANLVVAVAAGAIKEIGPLARGYVATNGKIPVAYSATATVTRRAYRVGEPA